jgi:hypothetical protein
MARRSYGSQSPAAAIPVECARMTRAASWAGPAALALAMAAAATWIFTRGDELTFYVDQWDFMLQRRGHSPGVFLEQQNGHFMAVPILVHKTLFEIFGVESYVPYRLTAIAVELIIAGLVFVLVRRRVGDLVAVAFAAVVLFFGPGWEPLISAVGMCNTISLAAGLGMLIALDAGTRRGDVAAMLLLGLSVASFSYGPIFAAAAAVDVLLRPGGVRRLWIAVIPLVVYGLWLLRWGGESDTELANLPGLARSVADSASAVAASVTGLYRPGGAGVGAVSVDEKLGWPLALALAGGVAYRLRGPARESPRLWALVVLTLLFWISIGLAQDEGRTPTSSRYLYPGGVFVLLIVAELLRGVRLGRRGVVLLGVWTVVVLAAGATNLRWAGVELTKLAQFDRAELAALELVRANVPPGYSPEASVHPQVRGHYLFAIVAGSYFSAIDDYGSPAYSVSELRRAPPEPRQAADLVLAETTGLSAVPAAGRAPRGPPPALEPGGSVSSRPEGSCLRLEPREPPGRVVLTVPPGGLLIDADQAAPLDLRLRRFADGFPVALGAVSGRSRVAVTPARDAATQQVPWHARLDGIRDPVLACGV